MPALRILILGHSFIRRLRSFIERNHEYDLSLDFNLTEHVVVGWHGVGGRTVQKINQYDLDVVESFRPDIVFLQVGTNDLTHANLTPVLVGSAIEDLVRLLREKYGVKIVCVGQTIHREAAAAFNKKVDILTRYLRVVLEPLPYAIYWGHRGFWNSKFQFYSYDGVHLNSQGHRKLYRSLRGAILKCCKSLHDRS